MQSTSFAGRFENDFMNAWIEKKKIVSSSSYF